jgi:hypothetical protein
VRGVGAQGPTSVSTPGVLMAPTKDWKKFKVNRVALPTCAWSDGKPLITTFGRDSSRRKTRSHLETIQQIANKPARLRAILFAAYIVNLRGKGI